MFLSVTADDANDREGKDGGHADAAGAGASAGAVAVDVADDAPETQGAHGVSAAVERPDGRLVAPVYRRTFNLRAQFMALAGKSFWVQSRRKKTLCFQLLLPVAMVFLMFLLQLVVTATVQDLQGKECVAPFAWLGCSCAYTQRSRCLAARVWVRTVCGRCQVHRSRPAPAHHPLRLLHAR